jgi:hypothetical protein
MAFACMLAEASYRTKVQRKARHGDVLFKRNLIEIWRVYRGGRGKKGEMANDVLGMMIPLIAWR